MRKIVQYVNRINGQMLFHFLFILSFNCEHIIVPLSVFRLAFEKIARVKCYRVRLLTRADIKQCRFNIRSIGLITHYDSRERG